MRKLCLIYSLVFFLISSAVIAQSGIDLAHKSIGKEIRRTYKIDNFQLCKLNAKDSISMLYSLQEHYYVVQKNVTTLGYLYVGRVNCCRAEGCSDPALGTEVTGFEYFDYLILYDSLCAISSVRVFNYQATYGHEICSHGWLKQFSGYSNNSELIVGDTIDAISGATISVMSITYDIERASAYLIKILELLNS